MPKKAGIAIVILGAVLIVSALLLFLKNRQEDRLAGQEAESLLVQVEAAIQQRQEASPEIELEMQRREPDDDAPQKDTEAEDEPEELPVVLLDGFAYIGILDLPVLGLRLPVFDQWDYERLKIAPCRQFGAVDSDDLVIAAHNYISHFARLGEMQVGDEVCFTDMDGQETVYLVSAIQVLEPTQVDEVQNSGHDLVLYTCTVGGQTRLTLFCDRREETP